MMTGRQPMGQVLQMAQSMPCDNKIPFVHARNCVVRGETQVATDKLSKFKTRFALLIMCFLTLTSLISAQVEAK